MNSILLLCFFWLFNPILGCSQPITQNANKKTGDHVNLEEMVFVKEGKFVSGCSLKKCDLPLSEQAQKYKGGLDDEIFPDFNIAEMVIYVEAFWIDKTEVTVGDYRDCVDTGKCSDKDVNTGNFVGMKFGCNWKEKDEHLPMNCVDWHQAKTYCAWKGKRLPKAIEWEKACRGAHDKYIHWDVYQFNDTRNIDSSAIGNAIDVSVYKFQANKKLLSPLVHVYNDGYALSAPVGSYPRGKSPYGAFDMLGNVSEWTNNEGKGNDREVRGGSFIHYPEHVRPWTRWYIPATARRLNIGFRCAFTPQDKDSKK